MPDYTNLINNLNRKLFFKFNKIKVTPAEGESKEKTVSEYLGPGGGFGFNQHYGGERYPGSHDRSADLDVPDVSGLDDDYVTHQPTHIKPDHDVKASKIDDDQNTQKEKENDKVVDLNPGEMREQDEELAPEPAIEEPAAEPDMGDVGADPGMGADPGIGDPGLGGDPNAMMPGEEEPKTPNELGRTYEMKKIYSRLVSMNEYLADERSPKILKTKLNIAKAIDLFSVIGANPDSYTEKIDEIIIGYYKFLEAAYKRIRSFYKLEAKRVGGTLPFENKEEQKDNTETDLEVTTI